MRADGRTFVLGMIEAALDKIGFTARGVHGDWDSLFSISTAIAHAINQRRSDSLCGNPWSHKVYKNYGSR